MSLYLDGTSGQKLQVLLNAAVATNNLPCLATWRDYNSSSPSAADLDRTSTTVSGTTAVDLVPAPSAGVKRTVLSANVYNEDTADAIVTIRVYDGSSNRIQHKVTLKPGYTLQYSVADDFVVVLGSGARLEGFIYAQAPPRPVRNIHNPNGASGVGRGLCAGTSPSGFLAYFGRADYPYSSVSIAYSVRVAGAGLVYAEAACVVCPAILDTVDNTGKVIAYTDVSGVINSLGVKTTAIDLTSGGASLIKTGDHIFVGLVATQSAGTNPSLEGFNPAVRLPQLGMAFQPSLFLGTHRIIPYDTGGGVFPFAHAVFS